MSEIKIFKCIGNEVESVPEEVLQELGGTYEELNQKAEGILLLSTKLKKMKDNSLCRVPFCHTVEAEAFGSSVTYDHKYGNRIKEYAIDSLDSIPELKFDTSKGRILEVVKSIEVLKAAGEDVVVEITGPFTIATSVIDSQTFFKALRKDKEKAKDLLEIITVKTAEYIRMVVQAGADVISITDPAGTLDITGEKIYRELSGPSTLKILEMVKGDLGDALIHLCGKTSTSLERIGKVSAESAVVEGRDYYHRMKRVKEERPEARLFGHWCMKTRAERSDVMILTLE